MRLSSKSSLIKASIALLLTIGLCLAENHPLPLLTGSDFPSNLDSLREIAFQQGSYFDMPGNQYRIQFLGVQGYALYTWSDSIPFNPAAAEIILQEPPTIDRVIFVEGSLEALATDPANYLDYGITGRITVAACDNIWLEGNLRYSDSDSITGEVLPGTPNCLGLASEKNIIISNTWENGKDNGGGLFPNDPWRSDIIMDGAYLALDDVFTFEDQNYDSTWYGGIQAPWYYSNGPSPDERGIIHQWGSITQYYRGYVYNSNHGGTGYLKDYHFYFELWDNPPPYFPYLPVLLFFDQYNFGCENTIVGDTSYLEIPVTIISAEPENTLYFVWDDIFLPGDFSVNTPGDSLVTGEDTTIFEILFHPQTPGEKGGYLYVQCQDAEARLTIYGEALETSVETGPQSSLSAYNLEMPYPNPFNASVSISFELPVVSEVELVIYDIQGKEISQLATRNSQLGTNTVVWDASAQSSGIYFARLTAGEYQKTQKLVLIK